MIQSDEKTHYKLSQIEGRSRKSSRHETVSEETETISTKPRHKISNFGLETETMSRDLTSLPCPLFNVAVVYNYTHDFQLSHKVQRY